MATETTSPPLQRKRSLDPDSLYGRLHNLRQKVEHPLNPEGLELKATITNDDLKQREIGKQNRHPFSLVYDDLEEGEVKEDARLGGQIHCSAARLERVKDRHDRANPLVRRPSRFPPFDSSYGLPRSQPCEDTAGNTYKQQDFQDSLVTRRPSNGLGNVLRGMRRDSMTTTCMSQSSEQFISGFPTKKRKLTAYSRRSSPLSQRSVQSIQRSKAAYESLAQGLPVETLTRVTDRIWDSKELVAGTIVSAPYHSQARRDIVEPIDMNISYTAFGSVHSKYRKMVILEKWGEHNICVPLYTYNGRGLEGREAFQHEYLQIREAYYERYEDADEPLMAIRHPNWDENSSFVNSKTAVKMTEKINLYRWDVCSIEGKLTDDSLLRLCEEYERISRINLTETMRRRG
ncbi:hypothetical protein BGZ63DRAFT_451924 [Mariannaea sp. PMI_226]|nr:hypothetical protein BGZ63DRAFT_451924 [Mariannaea sp. PMI_226]